MENITHLTKSEEQVMLKLWLLKKASVKDLVELYKTPKPAYNTVSTIVRILEKKKFINHKKRGRGYVYLPSISKESYASFLSNHLLENYFDSQPKKLISSINKSKSLTDLL